MKSNTIMIRTVATLGAIPAACMFLFTIVGMRCAHNVSPDVVGALQHFASGILLCTISTELLPEMVNAAGVVENVAAFIGFFAGVTVLIIVGRLLPEPHGDGDDDGDGERGRRESGTSSASGATATSRSSSLRQKSKLLMAIEASDATTASSPSQGSSLRRSADYFAPVSEDQPLVMNSLRFPSPTRKPFPTALIIAIVIDSFIDGLLIGIASSAATSQTAGPMMAGSLAVEMGFLGLTLATAMSGGQHPIQYTVPASLVGPLAIVGGAIIGGLISEALRVSPVYLVALLSFGTSALLFMVAEELLLEAHEEGLHVWWVDLQLYTGFFVSIMAGKFAG